MNDQIIWFNTGDATQTHRIIINDDNIACEDNPNENMFSNIALDSDIPDISVTVSQAVVTIDDSLEGDCCEFREPCIEFHNLNMFTVVYPVEEFEGNISSSGASFIFTWAPPRIRAELTTHYDLTCVPLLQGIPPPQGLSLSNTETSAEMSGLYSGVTYNCNISAVTTEGSSQPKQLILSTPVKGKCTRV